MATELEKIISVSGKSGLFKVVSAGKVAVVAESLVDGKRQPILSTQRVSTLADISMFTYEEDVPLKQVLLNMKNVYGDSEGPSANLTGTALREEFKKVLPDFDEDRVYDSDIKKLFNWYGLLKSRDMLDFEASEETTSEESEENA
ncbi:MAG: hypothetical protein RLZZ155_1416 [Bacteroidota bacterium]|jgi:hypothetical protein